LLGVLWAIAYAVVEHIVAGSFAGLSETLAQGWSSDWLYFSFVTMTTLGYGDVAPISATARTLAYMQAVFGQFYIAILVAGLVSAYISKKQR
ncbi:MAG: potassium channel family protein, partial [Gammaproteobacteria bacterium]|nr:potassium channel family protein [Gammaproteobacteria bacterium]